MLNALMRPRGARQTAPRRLLSLISDSFRSVAAPVDQVRELAAVTAPDPSDVFTTDELPTVEAIASAAAEFDRAADQARRADRGKRAAKKVLDKLPAGTYGTWRVFRTPSSRMTPDLAEITRQYKALNLGAVPMKPTAPSLKVERVEAFAEVTV